MRSGGVVTVVALLALAACNGDDDTAASTTFAAPPSTSAATTTAVSPSSSAPTTDQTTTTSNAPETTTTEATIPPTAPDTTLDPDDPVAQRIAVVEAVRAASQASLAVVRDPSNDEKLNDLENYFTGAQLEGWRNVVTDYRVNNLRQIENPDVPDALLIELASLAMNEATTLATVQACSITSGVVVEVGGNPDGTDRIIEDRIGRNVIELEVVRVDGRWKIEHARSIDDSDRIATCE